VIDACFCRDAPDDLAGKRLTDVAALAATCSEVTRDGMAWTTIYECSICGQLWEERFEERGHGEVPEVHRLNRS
jgi:hypothetical protein